MSRSLMLIVLGVVIALSPFSGLPLAVLTWILPVLGLIAIAIGVSYRMRARASAEPVHEAPLTLPS